MEENWEENCPGGEGGEGGGRSVPIRLHFLCSSFGLGSHVFPTYFT